MSFTLRTKLKPFIGRVYKYGRTGRLNQPLLNPSYPWMTSITFKYFSTHKFTLRRININKANELFEKYSNELPDYINVNQSSKETFKIIVTK